MNLKKIYRNSLKHIEYLPQKIDQKKVWLMEWCEIILKYRYYKNVHWSKSEKEEFERYWKENYGKKISSRWHKLYQSMNGIFNIEYIPEIIFTSKLEPMGNDYYYVKTCSHKDMVELFTNGTDVNIPKTILSCRLGCIRDSDYKLISEEKASWILGCYNQVIVKPSRGSSSGNGVCKEAIYNAHEQIKRWKERYLDDFVVQEIIQQCDELRVLHPESVNTIRVITFQYGCDIRTAPLTLRIGTEQNVVDNAHAGGLCVHLQEDGKLSEYAYKILDSGEAKVYKEHPDTGIVFNNCRIPKVQEIIGAAKLMHVKIPNIKYVSWDFTISEKGQIMLIEINLKGASVWFPQIISGKSLFGDVQKQLLKDISIRGIR